MKQRRSQKYREIRYNQVGPVGSCAKESRGHQEIQNLTAVQILD